MAVNSKQKGSRGERECAAIFQKFLGGYFQRVPQSGAFIGKKNNSRKEYMSDTQIRASKSDIIPPDEYPKLVIECKNYKDLPYHGFVTDIKIDKIDTWIVELESDCDEDDFGVLCFKTNRKKWSICFHTKYLHKFQLKNYSIYNNYIISDMEYILEHNKDIFIELSN